MIEIKQGDAGHTGSRTITHVAKRGTTTLTGGTWSMGSTNLGTGVPAPSATIDSLPGTVTLSNVIMSGSYTVLYTHTDGIVTELTVNVTYVPTPAAGVVSARTGTVSNTSGVGNTSVWTQLISLTLNDCPAGRAVPNSFGLTGGSRIAPVSGTGTAEHRCRLLVNGSQVAITTAQQTVNGGVIGFAEFSALFEDAHTVPAGTVTIAVEIQRTSGTGTITSSNNRLDYTVIAT